MSRQVIIFSVKTRKREVLQSSATTWGALKSEISAKGMDLSGMKATEKESKMSYEASSNTLPTGDFTVILTPTKVKSGLLDMAAEIEAMKEEIREYFG